MEEKLKIIYKECIEEINKIGITFNGKNINICISKRNNKRYGCCKPELPDEDYKKITRKGYRYIIKYENYKKYTIEISSWVMELQEDIIKNTIIHELIHCLPYCNNHGEHFKSYAQIINRELGYNISRLGNKKEDCNKSNIEYTDEETYKYKVICKNCGNIFYRKRLVKNFTKKYRCVKCMGKFDVIDI